MKIFSLNEGLFTVDSSKVFQSFNKTTDRLENRPDRSVLLTVQPFVVSTEADVILLDTGLGFLTDGKLQIIDALQKVGIEPQQVTKVILSHLHKDHTGGIGQSLPTGRYQMHFSKAQYYIQRREFAYALAQKGNASYHEPTLAALGNHEQVVWLETDNGQINNQISFAVSGGHTPFHQTIWIRENAQTVFYGADELPRTSYLQNNYAYKNDYDGKKSRELRTQWIEQAQTEKWTLLFYHDFKQAIIPPVIKQGSNL